MSRKEKIKKADKNPLLLIKLNSDFFYNINISDFMKIICIA